MPKSYSTSDRAVVRTRFAPSPTGSLHVGNARIAVLDWLFTRKHGGRFVLRIEDTDIERHDPAAEAGIFDDLEWLGLDWDEGPGPRGSADRGENGPYRQSQRRAAHHDFADRLRETGRTYHCYCSAPEEIDCGEDASDAAATSHGVERPATPPNRTGPGPRADCHCASMTAAEITHLRARGREPALRFRVPATGEIVVHDSVRGEVRFRAAEIADFVLLRADGRPTYNFAVVADDIAMRITHVIRGVGHLSNTPRQVLLYDALGVEPPVFVHVPTVLGPDRHKLSKRHGARALADYRAEGYHPDAVLNYLSLLSWSSPSGEEVLERDRLIEEVSIDRIGASDVVFDPVKLSWLSARHIERMPLQAVVEAVDAFARRAGWLEPHGPIPTPLFPEAVDAVRTHLSTFGQIGSALAPLFPARDAPSTAATPPRVAAVRAEGSTEGISGSADEPDLDASAEPVLRAAIARLTEIEEWKPQALAAAVKQAGKAAGAAGRALYEPLRLALTGRPHGPPLTAILRVQGRSRALRALASSATRAADRSRTSSDT